MAEKPSWCETTQRRLEKPFMVRSRAAASRTTMGFSDKADNKPQERRNACGGNKHGSMHHG
jgi:hypothetical protein